MTHPLGAPEDHVDHGLYHGQRRAHYRRTRTQDKRTRAKRKMEKKSAQTYKINS